jgi:hypothetical protein
MLIRESGSPGAGGTIVVDPEGLRRASAFLLGAAEREFALAARIRAHPLPELPASLGAVGPELAALAAVVAAEPPVLQETAQELRVRALWADIADRLTAGYDLEGSLLDEFKVAMASGLLLRYGEPWQDELASAYAKKLQDESDHGGILGFFEDVGGGIADFFEGAWDAVAQPVAMLYRLTPLNSDWTQQWEQLGQGLAYGATHPLEFGKALIGLDALRERGFAYWIGNLAPAAAATVLSGGAAGAVRGMQGLTAAERAGLTSARLAGLTERQAAAVIMRGAKPVPGSLFARGAPVAERTLAARDPVLGLFRKELPNFSGPVEVRGPMQPERWLVNGHDAARNPLAPHPERSFKYSGDPAELLRMRSGEEFAGRYALPAEWGDRNAVSVLHIPEGQRGWSLSGETAAQKSYGAAYVGGAQQHLLHTVSTHNVVWTGPLPWERVPDLGYAAHEAGRAALTGSAALGVTHAPPALETGR